MSLGFCNRTLLEPKTHYPNAPVTLLPKWCKRGVEDCCWVSYTEKKTTTKFRKWIAKWYSKVWFIDDYSTSGANISDAIKPPPVGISV